MTGNLSRPFRLWIQVCVLLCASAALAGCGTVTAPWLPQTTVAPLPGEDLSKPCVYSLRLAGVTGTGTSAPNPVDAPFITQKAVLVIYERGDSSTLFNDPKVVQMASQLQLAEVFANECDAASFPDFQPDATKGPGRALFQALTQFATITDHPELAQANVILSGFSAAGYLSVTMANAYPTRVLGAIPHAPASAYFDLDNVQVSQAAAQIPMLILAGATDIAAGTQRPYNLFLRGWNQGAPWGFGVENLNHCCTDSVNTVMIPWVTALMSNNVQPSASGALKLRPLDATVSPSVRYTCTPDGLFDAIGWQDCGITEASILPSTSGGPQVGWLPDQSTANAWLSWVLAPH